MVFCKDSNLHWVRNTTRRDSLPVVLGPEGRVRGNEEGLSKFRVLDPTKAEKGTHNETE